MADIILRLKRFVRADLARCDRVFIMAGPSPKASVRVARASSLLPGAPAGVCTVPDVATIAPPTVVPTPQRSFNFRLRM